MNSNAKEEMNPIKEKYKAMIIIPAYNAETTIHRAVDSAVNQTTKEPYEILLMDDGSTDSTSHILDDYAKLHKNIRTIHQKNQGITRTRENAAAAALGTYIFWIDADDYADEKLLEKALPPLEAGNDVVVYGVNSFRPDGSIEEKRIRALNRTTADWKKDTLNALISTLWTYGTKRSFWMVRSLHFR